MSTLEKCADIIGGDLNGDNEDKAREIVRTLASNLDEKAVETAVHAWNGSGVNAIGAPSETEMADMRAVITAYLTTIAEQET